MHEFTSFLKYLATSNTINFIIMLGILYWIVKKFDLGKILNNQIRDIQQDIVKTEEKKEEAQVLLNKSQKMIDNIPKDIKQLDKNCEEKIDIFENQISETTQKNIVNINENILKVHAIDEKKISNLITESAAKTSVEQAKENIINLLNSKPDLHNKFIQNSIDELDKVKL